jgi:hypothetical protein
MSQGLPEGDEGASEVEEGTVVSADSFPSDEQPAEAVVPGVGALHDPAARLALDPADERLIAPAPDVGRDPTSANGSLSVGVVVPFVEAEVLGPAWTACRPQDDGIECLGDQPLFVNVGAGDLCGERDAAAIGQDVAFDAAFRAIGGVGTREIPPFGAFTMALSSEDHFHGMPRLRS